jgi:phage baseplate assembly protein W
MHVDYPLRFDSHGRSATTDTDGHIRDLVTAVLLTSPGERANRPAFGSGLLQLTFAPNSPELAAATQFLVQGALQQWLGDLILVEEVSVVAEDAELDVTVSYIVRRSQERQVAQVRRGLTA